MELHELLRRVLLLAHDIEKQDPVFLRTLQNQRQRWRSDPTAQRLMGAMLSTYSYRDMARCERELIDHSGNIRNFERQHVLRVDPADEAGRMGELMESSTSYNLRKLRTMATTSQALEVVTSLVTCETYFNQLELKQGAVNNALS